MQNSLDLDKIGGVAGVSLTAPQTNKSTAPAGDGRRSAAQSTLVQERLNRSVGEDQESQGSPLRSQSPPTRLFNETKSNKVYGPLGSKTLDAQTQERLFGTLTIEEMAVSGQRHAGE